MKLFQQMLVACSALSLIAPIGVQASDINIEEIDTYVRKQSSSKKQKRFDSKSFSNDLATIKQKVDSSEVNYGLPIREFDSFMEASAEAAISRFYGGIHYMPAINEGVWQGRKVGELIWSRISTKPENLAENK